jgi:hypothetical protein
MKTNLKLALAVLAGVSIGNIGARAIHAQQVKTPPGYVVAEVEVTEPAALQKYAAQAPQIVASHGGHYVDVAETYKRLRASRRRATSLSSGSTV